MKHINGYWFPDRENNPKVFETVVNWRSSQAIRECLPYVKGRTHAIDIGAWVGDTTRFLKEHFQFVTAFEPVPDVRECLEQNVAGLPGVTIYDVALSDRSGSACMGSNATNSAWIDTKKERSGSIITERLDAFHFDVVDFIKIDVDSHEGFLLKGAGAFFRTHRPVVCIEVKAGAQNRQSSDLPNPHNILRDYGYRMERPVSHIDFLYLPD